LEGRLPQQNKARLLRQWAPTFRFARLMEIDEKTGLSEGFDRRLFPGHGTTA
jgi:hypothetical protein